MTDEQKLATIAKFDQWFNEATGWESWMVTAAKEREWLVNDLNSRGHNIPHKHQARTDTGGRVS